MGIQNRDVFEPENEAEALAIAALLEDHDIEAAVISFHDTAFDGVFQTQKGWGRIRVSADDEGRAVELISEWRDAEVDQREVSEDIEADEEESDEEEPHEATPKQRRMQGFVSRAWQSVGPLLLAVSVGVNIYLMVRGEPTMDAGVKSLFSDDDHLIAKLHYRKGAKGPYLVEEYDSLVRLLAKSHDENDDQRFERYSLYSPKALIIEEHEDADADGRYELSSFYHQRRLVARASGLDSDGRQTRLVQYHGDHPRAEFLDENHDGRYDTIELVTKQEGRAAKYTDRDGDGFPERVWCRGVDGDVTLDTLQCKLKK